MGGVSRPDHLEADSFWLFIGITVAQRAAASPLTAVASATAPAPLHLFASRADTVVDFTQSSDLFTALRAKAAPAWR